MRNWFFIVLAILVVAAVGGLVLGVLKPRELEPVYQRKPLTFWLAGYDEGRVKGLLHPDSREASEAVRRIGPSAVPTLLRLLRARDSTLALKLVRLIAKQQVIKIHYVPAATRHLEAAGAFEALGTAAQDAVPQLIEMYDHIPPRQSEIAIVLGYIGPPAKGAIPSVLRGTTSTSSSVRADAIFALGRIHAEPETVVPALIQALRDPCDSVRYSAVVALPAFRTNARPAVPALIELIPKERARTITPGQHFAIFAQAEHALKQIDPEAAAKAGMK